MCTPALLSAARQRRGTPASAALRMWPSGNPRPDILPQHFRRTFPLSVSAATVAPNVENSGPTRSRHDRPHELAASANFTAKLAKVHGRCAQRPAATAHAMDQGALVELLSPRELEESMKIAPAT